MKSKHLLLLLLMAVFAPWAANAQETLTVCDGTSTSSNAPIKGSGGSQTEFIYPASLLEDMVGGTITSVKFFSSSTSTTNYSNTVTVFVEEVASSTVSSSAWQYNQTTATKVYEGTTLSVTGGELVITFSTPYEYNGGNLCFNIWSASNTPSVSYYYLATTSACAYDWYITPPVSDPYSVGSYLPKAEFTYETASQGPTCAKPDALTANGEPTATEFSFTIEGGSGLYNIFTKAGDGEWTNWEYEWEETTVNLTGLTPATDYQVRVQSVCTDMTDPETGNAATSGWKTLSFTTECEAITTFPWSEDFESYAAGNFNNPCWVNEHISGNGTQIFKVYTSTSGTNSTHQLQLPDMNSGTMTKLRLPEMTLPTGDSYLFSIDVFRNASGSSYTSEGVRVFASTDGEIEGATELGFLYRNCGQTDGGVVTAETATGWYNYEFPIPFTGTCYIILRGESQYGSSTYMDNFKVKKDLPCVKPANPTFVSSTTTSATLSWTNGAEGQTAWQIAYSTDASFNPDEVTPVDVTSNPATIDGLTPSTIYYAYVRANCGDLGYSEWSNASCKLTTECDAITVTKEEPYTENFDSYTATSSSSAPSNYPDDELPLCWSFLNRAETSSTYPQVFLSSLSTYAVSGNCLFLKSSSSTPLYAILPEFENEISDLQLGFTYRNEGTSNGNGTLHAGYMTDPNDASTFVTVYTCPQTTAKTPVEDIYFTDAPAGSYIAFKYAGGTADNYYLSIDNVVVEPVPTCMKPGNFAATNVTNHSATLGWTAGNEGQNAWQIAYSTTSFDPNAADFDLTTVEVIDNVEETSYTFDKTLDAYTHYYMYVRGYCGDEDYSKWVGIDFTTSQANPSPTITSVDEITPVSAVLRWAAPAADYLESYDIYYSQTSGQPANDSLIQYTGVDAGFTSKILENLTEGYWYVYMRAYHGETDGYSSWTPYYGYGFQVPEACPKPTNLTAGNPTPNSITLTWTEGATWQYAWDVAYSTDPDFNPEDMDPDTFVDVFGQQGPTITCTVAGLQPLTTYYFRVMGHCNSPYGDCDEWTDAVSATTLDGCPVPFDLNVTTASNNATLGWTGFSDSYTVQYREATYDIVVFEEGFENELGDWNFTSMNEVNGIGGTGNYPAGILGDAVAHSGSYGFRFSSYSRYTDGEAYDQYLVSPELTVTGNLSFYAWCYGSGDHLYVGTSTTTDDVEADSVFSWSELTFNTYSSWKEFTQELPEDVKYIAFHYYGNYAFYAYVDDITINFPVPAGEWQDAGTTTSTSMTLNLDYGTKYDARVKAECSDYSEPITFKTKSLKLFTTDGAWDLASNWTPAGAPTMDEDAKISAAATINAGVVANADIITIDGGSITIEDGGQLVANSDVTNVTVEKDIVGYTEPNYETNNGYYFISNPLTTSVNPENAGLIEGTYDLYEWYANDPNGKEWNNYKDWDFSLSYYNHPGYLYANQDDVTLTFTGTVYSSMNKISVPVYYNNGAEFGRWNLIGNPFVCNAYLVDNAGNALPYYKMNAEGNGYTAVTNGAIAPVTGIFYETEANASVYFTREAPVTESSSEVIIVIEEGHSPVDNAIIRFGQGQQMSKFSFRENSSKVYIPMDGQNFAIVNAEGTVGEMPVSFEAEKNGTYSLNFTSQEVSFSYLHLIDNMTGTDVDLLQTPSYTFNATTSDYASRFRLVFATGSSVSNDSFSFINASGNLCIFGIEGKATVQVIDVMGHVLSSETFSGSYEKRINAAPGVYMIRLIQGNDVKVQKVVVK